MKIHALDRLRWGTVLGVAALALFDASGCVKARADEPSSFSRTDHDAAIASYEARTGGNDPSRGGATLASAACADGFVSWDRGDGIIMCAATCLSDAQCAPDERCRVVDSTFGGAVVFASDIQDEIDAAVAMVNASQESPIANPAPECDAECSPYSGDLIAQPAVPLALCDPFYDLSDWAELSVEAR